MIDTVDLMIKYTLTPAMARVLQLLLQHKMVTHKMVEIDRPVDVDGKQQKPIATDGKVLMHRLRRRLAGTDIVVHVQRSVGYWLDPASREKIMRELSEPKSLPQSHGGEAEVLSAA